MGVIYTPQGRAGEFAHLAANHYNGCKHACTYCYVPGFMHKTREDFHKTESVRKNVVEQILKEAPALTGTQIRVLLSFACDPYNSLDVRECITRKILKILRDYDIPFQILTKSGLRALRDFDLYGPDDMFAVTLTFLDEEKSKQYEPGAAPPTERIKSLRVAKEDFNIKTWVSLEPVIDAKETLEIIRQTHQWVDQYRIGKLNHKPSEINWQKFGIKAINLCREFQIDYFIKSDLAFYLGDNKFTNTDTRTVKR